jgi:hypothetical protein
MHCPNLKLCIPCMLSYDFNETDCDHVGRYRYISFPPVSRSVNPPVHKYSHRFVKLAPLCTHVKEMNEV